MGKLAIPSAHLSRVAALSRVAESPRIAESRGSSESPRVVALVRTSLSQVAQWLHVGCWPRVAPLLSGALLVCAGLGPCGCSTYQDHLLRGQRLYQQHEYDRALAMWRVLEPDMDSLNPEQQARFAYLRGMTDYRLGYRDDARHWLAIAKAMNEVHPGTLQGDWPERTDAALDELNQEVFGIGKFANKDEAVEHNVDAPSESGDTGAGGSNGVSPEQQSTP